MQNTHRKTPIPMHARESTTPSTGASAADVARDLAGPLTALIERYESFVKTLEKHRAAVEVFHGGEHNLVGVLHREPVR